jgi:hypothetical protein
MKLQTLIASGALCVGALLTVSAFVAGWATMSGKILPWVSDERGAFLFVGGLGFLACTVAGTWLGLQRAGDNWLDPFILSATILGAAILLLAFAYLTQKGPAWATGRPAFYLLLGLIGAKFLLATGHAAAKGVV